MSDRLKTLVVGSGWGRNHAIAYQSHPDAELMGICGRTASDRNTGLAHELQVPLLLGLEEAINRTQPDIVSIATKEPGHEAATRLSLAAGCHVYCEKMLADSVAAAERMVAVAKRTGKQLMTGYNYRFSPSALKLKQLVQQGALGDIAFCTALTFGYCLHHTLDLLCCLLGDVEEVYCVLNTSPADNTSVPYEVYQEFAYSASKCRSIHLKFRCGAIGTLISSDYMRVGHPAVRVDIVGSKARCNMTDIAGPVTTYRENREADLFLPSLILDRFDLPSTTQAAVTAFVDAIRDGRPVPVSGEEGLNRLIVERALMQSVKSNQPVRLSGREGGIPELRRLP